jgi:hypothetical protein
MLLLLVKTADRSSSAVCCCWGWESMGAAEMQKNAVCATE